MEEQKSQSKMMKTGFSHYSSTSSMAGNDIESLKTKKMSSMDKDIMKLLLKILQGGPNKHLTREAKDSLQDYAKTILDKERQEELEILIENLENGDDSSDNFLQIIKYYVLSPVEKNYISKIENELKKSEQLEVEIKEVQNRIKEEKDKKLNRYAQEKKGEVPSASKQTCEALLREISVHENKLEKANQKLNEIVANNNQLRSKIDVLRKEKVIIEDIYNKLKEELEIKKQNVEETIKTAGDAYYKRNRAEEELKTLQEKAEKQKEDFDKECQELNKNIQYDRRFKQFIKSKQKEKEVLENLEKQISRNKIIIEEKIKSNAMIDNEYQLSAQKEEEIKKAFERIKKETGIKSVEDDEMRSNESKKLLEVFINLYQKNTIMTKFVKELNEEVDELEKKIQDKKKELQMYSTKGATNDNKRRELKITLTNKIQQEEKKKQILKAQYEKSIETINLIKSYLENVFQAIDVDQETIEKLKGAAITEENMMYFLGILEQKGLDAISEYARLIAEQLKLEKGDQPGLAQQIDDLNNIIAYENANIMNYYSSTNQNKADCPEELAPALKPNYLSEGVQDADQMLTYEEMKKQALDVLTKKFTDKSATNQAQLRSNQQARTRQNQQPGKKTIKK